MIHPALLSATETVKHNPPAKTAHRWLRAGLALVLVVALAGCTTTQSPSPASSPTTSISATTPSASPSPTITSTDSVIESATFLSVVDGDTITTSAGTVRLIGIDTPEQGDCGHDEASTAIGRLLSVGDPVTLELPAGQNDQDAYGRLIRFVTTADGVDLGLMQLQAGHAIARYDSTDGYPAHPREAAYHAAQIATTGADGSVITTTCQNPTPTATSSASSTTSQWWEQYPSCAQLKRNTVGDPTGPFHRDDPAEAEIYDWFANRTGNNGDGDNDGLACE